MSVDKLIITAAICGAEVTRAQTPYIPLTPEEIANEAFLSYKAGASIVHLHVRDKAGKPTQDVEVFKKVIDLVKTKCPDLIIQVSTGGAVGMTPEERLQSIYAGPEMASLDTGTTNFGDEIFINDMPLIRHFASKMAEINVMPEFECFELGHVSNALRVVKEGIIKGHLHFDFVLGVPGSCPADARNLVRMVDSIPEDATWTVSGIGRHEFEMAMLAIPMGGNVRVGLEDNIYLSKGVLAKSNAELVEKVVRIARELGREIATPTDTRKILDIKDSY
jgi:3-keto-5-aminohexanoate cleavage enzyme